MADNKSDYLERKLLDHALARTAYTKPSSVYISLHTANPTDANTGGTEVTGGSYARKVMTFSAAATVTSVTSAANVTDIVWVALPSTTVTHVGIYDALTGGNLLYFAPLSASKVIASGDGYTISTGQLVVQEN